MIKALLRCTLACAGILSCLVAGAAETVVPSGFSVTEPVPGSTVKQISVISFKSTSYSYLTINSGVKVQINGTDVDATAELSGSAKSIVTYTLANPVTAAGEYEIVIPQGAVSYTYFGDSNSSGQFKFSVTVVDDSYVPTETTIPSGFNVTPKEDSEVESISEITIGTNYMDMVVVGNKIKFDSEEVEVSAEVVGSWKDQIKITLPAPVTRGGKHTILIPAGFFKYNTFTSSNIDSDLFYYTLTIPGGNIEDPEQPVIITEQPEGQLKTYDRTGSYYYNYDGYLRTGAQTGTIDIVFADNNKVYLKDPVNNMPIGSWVVGDLNEAGNTITVKLGQYLYKDAEYGYVTLRMVQYDDDYEWFDPIATEEVTYTIQGEKISINGTYRKGICLGVVWEEYNEWAGNADYGTVYVPVVDVEEVVVPDGVEINQYIFKGAGYGDTALEYTVNVAFDESDMYIQGIFTDTPKAWIKGTVDGDKVTFKSPQYLGKASYGTRSDLYMVAVALTNTYDIVDLVLTYDEENQAYVNDSQYLVLNTSKSTVYMVEAISNFSLNKVVSKTAYTVPYYEPFNSNAALNDYTILDANGDKNTWYFNSGKMSYDYCPKAGDDWLITPAIELEAGKTYEFSLQARSFASMYPERFEVKMGAEPTADAMATQVIAPTQVASDTMAPFTGKVKIETSGNYHFGVHAISDPDQFTLSVDDIKVVEAEDDSVTEITMPEAAESNTVYTLDGRIVSRNGITTNLAPGIYIRGGKKIVVR